MKPIPAVLERGVKTELFSLMKHPCSILKCQGKQIPWALLKKIIEAGIYTPNASGGQRGLIVGIRNVTLAETIGRWNAARFDRS